MGHRVDREARDELRQRDEYGGGREQRPRERRREQQAPVREDGSSAIVHRDPRVAEEDDARDHQREAVVARPQTSPEKPDENEVHAREQQRVEHVPQRTQQPGGVSGPPLGAGERHHEVARPPHGAEVAGERDRRTAARAVDDLGGPAARQPVSTRRPLRRSTAPDVGVRRRRPRAGSAAMGSGRRHGGTACSADRSARRRSGPAARGPSPPGGG